MPKPFVYSGRATLANWYRVGEAYVCVPNKNASTSFKLAVSSGQARCTEELEEYMRAQGRGPYTPEQVEGFADGPRYLSVRHPVERFSSLWRHVNRPSMAHRSKGFIADYGLHGLSPDALMDVIEQRPDENRHWIRQSAYEVEGMTPVPYDRLLEVLGLPVLRENVTAQQETPELPVDRIMAHYARDAELASA